MTNLYIMDEDLVKNDTEEIINDETVNDEVSTDDETNENEVEVSTVDETFTVDKEKLPKCIVRFFELYKKAEKCFVTEDEQVFAREGDAKNHASTLSVKEYISFKRQ